jgi:hypothetical protein
LTATRSELAPHLLSTRSIITHVGMVEGALIFVVYTEREDRVRIQ